MPDIDTISTKLRGIAAGIDRAQADAADAETTAQAIAARAAASGFAGFAAGMLRVREIISEIGAQLANINRAIAVPRAHGAVSSSWESPVQLEGTGYARTRWHGPRSPSVSARTVQAWRVLTSLNVRPDYCHQS